MSKRSDAKKARRRKRQVARDQAGIAHDAEERVAEIVAELQDFDAELTQRGWAFSADADADADDDVGVIWFWPPSYSEVDESELATATVIALIEAEGGDIAHVVFVGTSEDYQFGLEELFDHIETVEAYRIAEPLPVFG